MPHEGNATPTHKFWSKLLGSCKERNRKTRENYAKMAKAYRTMYHPREEGTSGATDFDRALVVENNYYFAFVDTMAAQIVPTNPQVTVKANRRALEKAADLREALINQTFVKEKLAEKLWGLASRSMIWPRSFLKVVWSMKRKRPIFRVINPHYIFYDLDAEDYEDIRYIAEVVPLTKADFKSRIRRKGRKKGFYRASALEQIGDQISFGKWPEWLEPDEDTDRYVNGEATSEQDTIREAYEWVVVYELYDLRGGKFYHFVEGVEEPLMETALPYQFISNPYKPLVFNDNLQDLGGMSDAELVFPTVERLNEMMSLEMWHCKTSIPIPVVHEGLVDDPESFMDAYEEVDGPGDVLALSAKANVGIDQVLGYTRSPSLPIEWDRVSGRLEKLIEFILGMPAYARGAVGESDVATELALSDTATRTRNARRQKAIYFIIEWAAQAVVALYQEFMGEDEEIPARLLSGDDDKILTKEAMQLSTERDNVWDYDYTSHPFNASELNDVVQLKQFEVFLPVLLQAAASGVVDMRMLMKTLLDLLHMPELLSKEQAQNPMAAMAGGGGGAAGPDASAGMPTGAASPMIGGEVQSGTGAQSVPGGLEGGAQPGGGGLAGLGGAPPMAGG